MNGSIAGRQSAEPSIEASSSRSSDPNSGNSQFFVMLSEQPHLNGRYTIFARVTRGLDLARRVQQGATIKRVDIRP